MRGLGRVLFVVLSTADLLLWPPIVLAIRSKTGQSGVVRGTNRGTNSIGFRQAVCAEELHDAKARSDAREGIRGHPSSLAILITDSSPYTL